MGSITSKPAFPPPPPRRWKKVLVKDSDGKIVAKYIREGSKDDRDPPTNS